MPVWGPKSEFLVTTERWHGSIRNPKALSGGVGGGDRRTPAKLVGQLAWHKKQQTNRPYLKQVGQQRATPQVILRHLHMCYGKCANTHIYECSEYTHPEREGGVKK